jgi:hypothetical protein
MFATLDKSKPNGKNKNKMWKLIIGSAQRLVTVEMSKLPL